MLFMFFLPAMILIFSVLSNRLAEKSVAKITYLVLSGILNLNLINQSTYITYTFYCRTSVNFRLNRMCI